MSKLLYKLGSFAARKVWVIIGIWALLFAIAGGSYFSFKGEMTSELSIPGTKAQTLADSLSDKFDTNANAGNGQVILETEDGSAFTDEQKQAVADAISKAEGTDQVDSIRSPFATAQEVADYQTKLEDAQKQLDDGKTKLEEAQKKLDDTQAQLNDGTIESQAQAKIDEAQAKLDEGRKKVEDGEAQAAAAKEKIDSGQAEIDSKKAELESGQQQLEAAQAELDAKKAELESGQQQLEAAQSQLDAQRQAATAAGADEATLAQLDTAQTQIDGQRSQLEQGAQQISDGQAQIDAQRTQLEDGKTQLQQAQAEVDSGRQQLEASQPELESGRQQVESGQAELDAQKQSLENGTLIADAQKQVTDGQAEVDKNRTELEKNQAEVDRNKALLEMSSDAVLISDDQSAAVVGVTFTEDISSITPENLASVRESFESLSDQNIKVLFDKYLEGVSPEMGMTGEIIGVIIALIVLFVMLGTLIAAGLPIIMAVVGLGVAMLGTLALSGVVEMTSTTPALGSMLGLAVGIDYTLFILNRHRANLAQGMDMKKSIALATGTSGGAVVFAGATVIIALLALNVVGIPFLSVMGNAAAFAVLMAVLVSVTLSPAVLSLIGRRIISKKRWETIKRRNAALESKDPETVAGAYEVAIARESKPGKWLKTVLAKPILTILAAVIALGVLALPMTSMRLGLPDGSAQPTDSAAYQSYMAIQDNFGEGQNGAVIVVATLPDGTSEDQAKELQVEVGQDLLKQNDVAKVIPAMISNDNDMLLYQVIPDEGPSAESTSELVKTIRDLTVDTNYGKVTFGATGTTAMAIDISDNLFKVLPTYVAIVVGLSLIVLILVFRSIWVPLSATLGFLFSLVAAFGITTAVFQWGWLGALFGVSTPGPILAFLPILVVGILFGLAMDYQVFLVSAMKEAYSHGRSARDAVVVGFNNAAKVVVTAALIMTGVFMGFVFSGDSMISSIGFALAFGVLFDAFIVRMTLIPALMHLLGEHAWTLPKWLDNILPDLDIEGTKLEEELDHVSPLEKAEETLATAEGASGISDEEPVASTNARHMATEESAQTGSVRAPILADVEQWQKDESQKNSEQ